MSFTIAVVIPTHNRLVGLQDSLTSVLRQAVLPDEVVVVDDGSRELVPDTIFESFPEHIEVKLIRNEVPKGATNARNVGVLASTADYISFLDDDDKFKANKIKEIKKIIAKEPHLDLIYHPAHIHMINEGVSYYSRPKEFQLEDNVFRQLLVQNFIGGTPMVTVKRQTLINVGLFDEHIPALEDYELWLRMSKYNCNFYFLNEPLTDYMCLSKRSSLSKDVDKNLTAIKLIENKYADDYNGLTEKELKNHELWKIHLKLHKSLLGGRRVKSIKYQLIMFLNQPRIFNFLLIGLVLLGPTVIFKLKARISK